MKSISLSQSVIFKFWRSVRRKMKTIVKQSIHCLLQAITLMKHCSQYPRALVIPQEASTQVLFEKCFLLYLGLIDHKKSGSMMIAKVCLLMLTNQNSRTRHASKQKMLRLRRSSLRTCAVFPKLPHPISHRSWNQRVDTLLHLHHNMPCQLSININHSLIIWPSLLKGSQGLQMRQKEPAKLRRQPLRVDQDRTRKKWRSRLYLSPLPFPLRLLQSTGLISYHLLLQVLNL